MTLSRAATAATFGRALRPFIDEQHAMTNREIARRGWKEGASGTLILDDDARVRFEAISSYRDNDGDFSITLETPDGEKAYHSDQIREIHLDQSKRTEKPSP